MMQATGEWLFDLRKLPLTAAANALRETGAAVCLVETGALLNDLPPSLPEEIAASATHPHPAGFLLRRRIARSLATTLQDTQSDDLAIIANSHGRPGFRGLRGLHVSFSARAEFGLIGIATVPIGVDIEAPVPVTSIPLNLLTRSERQWLDAFSSDRRAKAFQALWCAKEAAVKADGRGFETSPEKVGISLEKFHIDSDYRYINARISNSSSRLIPVFQLNHPKGFEISMALLSDGVG